MSVGVSGRVWHEHVQQELQCCSELRWMINPLVRLLLGIGINPLGLAILETRGRVSGLPRRTPISRDRS